MLKAVFKSPVMCTRIAVRQTTTLLISRETKALLHYVKMTFTFQRVQIYIYKFLHTYPYTINLYYDM